EELRETGINKCLPFSDCLLPTDSGPCDAYFPRYSTPQFVHDGCRGNGNNFLSIGECEKNCVPIK
ncbi:Hypothetical predicted protein, partial [Mytilus galloprovincialis]